jgi:polyisoprenoid-binding protein YceI
VGWRQHSAAVLRAAGLAHHAPPAGRQADAGLAGEWFNAAKFAQASLAGSTIKPLGGGSFELRGKLAIKGATQDMVVPVTIIQTTGAAGTAGAASAAVGSFVIKRLDFKIGEGEWADTSMVANDVTVKFKLALTGMAPL